MSKTLQKPIECRNARCGASCSPADASVWSGNPKKCPYYEYDPTGYEQEKIERAYQQGRTDVINQVEEWLKMEFVKQNNPNSKYVPTIVINELVFTFLEQIKEQKNESR